MNTVATRTVEQHPADFSPQSGGVPSVKPMAGVERVFGAQQVQVYRDEARVLQKLKTLAAAAGGEWFYRYPVRKKIWNEETQREEWGTDWIEGPSIKLANDLARIYGNCDVDTRVIDLGDSWLFYARIIDLESGFSLTRPYQQRKAQASVATKDPGRAQDIAFQIGTSKAIRNVVVNALQTFSDFAFEEARNALVEKVGKDVEGWRKRTVESLARVPVAVQRVELVIGRAAKDWLAPDIARIIAMLKSIADGMATVNETFPDPNKPPAEERQSRTVDDVLDQFGSGGSGGEPPPGAGTQATTDEAQESVERTSAPTSGGGSSESDRIEEYRAQVRAKIDAATTPDAINALMPWFVSDSQRETRERLSMSVSAANEVKGWIIAKVATLKPKK